jgi:hypothetical protein
MSQQRETSVADIMEVMEQTEPGMKACWGIISRGAEYHLFDYGTLREVIESLIVSQSYINEELGFEIIEGKLRVSLLNDQAFCDPRHMISQLQELQRRYEAAQKDQGSPSP